jgi:hypothetical protein
VIVKYQVRNGMMILAAVTVVALMPFSGETQAQQAKSSTIQHFNKAFGACMEGRGYTVK